jgi:epoxyqueuosine reductase
MKVKGTSQKGRARERLLSCLDAEGCTARLVPVERLADLREAIEDRHRKREFDEGFYQERLAGFTYELPSAVADARSLFVVAVPQAKVRVTFTWKGRPVETIVPPTYLHWQETDRRIEGIAREVLEPFGFCVAQIPLPKKTLAVGSGLARYGRNNITYVPGLGSFHRLVALASDLPSEEGAWLGLEAMEHCGHCSACLRACPTGAIGEDRFLLHAERCLTFWNEKPPDVPFPSWIAPSWHNALVGCLACQRACPENRDVFSRVEEGPSFDEEATALFLKGICAAELASETVAKLKQADLVDFLDVLPRNLGALVDQRETKGRER